MMTNIQHRFSLEQLSAEVSLVSCVVLWYTVSSFAIRRRGLDQYQSLFFLVAGGAVAGVAVVVEASKHVVLLAYVPWAACLAMAASSAAHTLWRQMLQPEANQDMLADGKYFAPWYMPYHRRNGGMEKVIDDDHPCGSVDVIVVVDDAAVATYIGG
ncbi:uncharacterized protein SPSK_10904 [Sporothrix schenckii 1099-18]|uniref:Uncharacterized protein n=1 Tax=Sporothrix schenckii 1099-18 TaxID=1397361 RepID=A0A0F2M9N2_SPOSC|nr:uncharacterized protein SPSK_10904 [Sporothrix schenckii 1099-18]KJR84871.1 hypothetical protein SPSK_10904 [Sporothrix schenckii 1099-18]